MERSGIARWLFIGLTVLLAVLFLPKLFGEKASERQPLQFEGKVVPATRKPEQLCDLWGPRFHAQLSTQGASLKHFYLVTAKYRQKGQSIDLATTPDVELRRQLRFHFRNERFHPADDWQVDFDEVDYDLIKADGKTCELVYRDAKVELRRTIRTTEHPYELEAEATITNLAEQKLKHALTVHTDAWRTNAEVESGMFRVSPFITHVECVSEANKATRMRPPDFEPDKFKGEAFSGALNAGDWYETKQHPAYAAVSNAYFSHALVPVAAPSDGKPTCQLQIEHWGSAKDPKAGAMYRARLAYPAVTLNPKESARYAVLTFVGPKEREALAAVGGGKRDLTELIDLGFFSVIAKVLVAFLLKVHSVLPNWGLAIIILTITARVLLFPLAVPSIKSMIKMRELKPELDAMNEKFKDDAQAKGLAQMELWRKHNVNPLKGCLPQMASMPVWFALYTTLQTAVELFNIPFLWFPDLSQPDRFFILPFIIGATNFAQQKLMPMQGDPMQQKMMLYFMPAMFTVFMLFLPAGLGVYMFTNGLLTIAQQQIVESYVRRQTLKSEAEKKSREIGVKIKEEASS
ncbi:MAG: membrane protein insertase YidC [Myxococcales bacterium]|nr:membrane protein insertase YidC [Myxococcales bacterium]